MKLLVLLTLCVAVVLACYEDGKKRYDGEKWVSGRFQLRCRYLYGGKVKVDVVGCATILGYVIPIGTTKKRYGYYYECSRKWKGLTPVVTLRRWLA